ncbi:MAG: GntR family transcriptional regulator [Methylotenera sp.]|nr:GntR family transcriptional regulator [Methylotenera sp.]MDO9233224.1 GntR family transcriptional regulator [Methylotenera sp.]MDO9389034.1 GntR family transcriptional regulator [Methylotenera sp.]MDP2404533.1 GntR family transcriptional regulator [Methylotenera sp.]MDP3095550.1 GntR family transcriptional regulator [Methylotenera sp.]
MNKQLISPSYRPLYDQIKVLITQSLIGGEWRPGEMIPSEFELAARYKVSQGTVRKAIDNLAAENILIRRQGKGTFVATHKADVTKLRFLRLTSVTGDKELLENKFISCIKTKADSYISKILGVKVGAATIEVKRLLTFSGRPLIYDHIIVPAASFKGLNGAKVEESKGSMYSMYESQFGVRMIRAEECLKAVVAEKEVASALGLKEGYPLLSIERVSFTYGDKPMEWRLGLCLTDDHHYLSELE